MKLPDVNPGDILRVISRYENPQVVISTDWALSDPDLEYCFHLIVRVLEVHSPNSGGAVWCRVERLNLLDSPSLELLLMAGSGDLNHRVAKIDDNTEYGDLIPLRYKDPDRGQGKSINPTDKKVQEAMAFLFRMAKQEFLMAENSINRTDRIAHGQRHNALKTVLDELERLQNLRTGH